MSNWHPMQAFAPRPTLSGAPAVVDERLKKLKPHELVLLSCLSRGMTNVEIGRMVHRSEKTIRNQLTRVYAQVGATNRAGAVAIFLLGGGRSGDDDGDHHRAFYRDPYGRDHGGR